MHFNLSRKLAELVALIMIETIPVDLYSSLACCRMKLKVVYHIIHTSARLGATCSESGFFCIQLTHVARASGAEHFCAPLASICTLPRCCYSVSVVLVVVTIAIAAAAVAVTAGAAGDAVAAVCDGDGGGAAAASSNASQPYRTSSAPFCLRRN